MKLETLPTFKFILSDGAKTWDLPQAPDGWEESFLEWARSLENYGIIRSYSIPLKWVLDGAYFLRDKFYIGKNGVQAFTLVRILKLNPSTLEYLPYYTGALDYSTFIDNPTGVQAGLMDSGLDERIKAHGNTLLEIPLDTTEAENVLFPGILLSESATLVSTALADWTTNNFVTVGFEVGGFEAKSNVTTARDAPSNPPTSTGGIPDGDGWFFESPIDQDVSVKGSIEIQANVDPLVAPSPRPYDIDLVIGTAANARRIGSVIVPPDNVLHTYTFPFDFPTVPILKGQKLWVRIFSTITENSVLQVNPTDITLGYKTISSPSKAKALQAAVLFDKLIQKINGGIPGGSISHLLTNYPFREIYYTSGDALRGFEKATIKISLNDFLKDWFSIACAGFGIENEIAVLERRDYFFRKGQKIGELKAVKAVTFEVGEKYIYSAIKTGSPNQNINEINARSEVNSEQTWSAPITRVTQEYNIVTASRTDAYGIEATRVNLAGQTTTDSKSDNDTFILHTYFDNYLGRTMATKAGHYIEVDGVEAPDTVYNLFLSPKKNLLRHNYWLASALWGLENYYINFQAALKNAELRTVDPEGVTVKENENIAILTLGPKIYVPILATVNCIYDRTLSELINSTPYGYLEFTWLDNKYKGFILEASVNPANNESKQFKLLLTSDNSLVNLIR